MKLMHEVTIGRRFWIMKGLPGIVVEPPSTNAIAMHDILRQTFPSQRPANSTDPALVAIGAKLDLHVDPFEDTVSIPAEVPKSISSGCVFSVCCKI